MSNQELNEKDLAPVEINEEELKGLLDDAGRRASDVECSHRQLGARLTDGLRGNDAHGRAQLD